MSRLGGKVAMRFTYCCFRIVASLTFIWCASFLTASNTRSLTSTIQAARTQLRMESTVLGRLLDTFTIVDGKAFCEAAMVAPSPVSTTLVTPGSRSRTESTIPGKSLDRIHSMPLGQGCCVGAMAAPLPVSTIPAPPLFPMGRVWHGCARNQQLWADSRILLHR